MKRIKMNLRLSFEKFLSKIFIKTRGNARDHGGDRELSSGILSDKIRKGAVNEATSHRGKLLEVGSGEGLTLELIKDIEGYSLLIGLELAEDMIKKCCNRLFNRGSHRVNLLRGLGQRIPIKDNSINSVICVNTFHNLHSFFEVEEILKEICRVCASDGVVIFDIRNSYNPLMYFAYKWVMAYDPTCRVLPLNTYSYFKVRHTLKKLGFQVIKKRGILFPFWILAPAMVIEAWRS